MATDSNADQTVVSTSVTSTGRSTTSSDTVRAPGTLTATSRPSIPFGSPLPNLGDTAANGSGGGGGGNGISNNNNVPNLDQSLSSSPSTQTPQPNPNPNPNVNPLEYQATLVIVDSPSSSPSSPSSPQHVPQHEYCFGDDEEGGEWGWDGDEDGDEGRWEAAARRESLGWDGDEGEDEKMEGDEDEGGDDEDEDETEEGDEEEMEDEDKDAEMEDVDKNQDQGQEQRQQHGGPSTHVVPVLVSQNHWQKPLFERRLLKTENRMQQVQLPLSDAMPPETVKKFSRIDFWKLRQEYRVGRFSENGIGIGDDNIRIRKNDIVLPSARISNLHAIFRWNGHETHGAGASILDLSTNGTYLNGELIGKGITRLVRDGDEVAFGPPDCTDERREYRYTFRYMAAGCARDPNKWYGGYR
ncbi:hypothetical protein K435DRAFT_798072 [Dendrothele bispora CBS 962.96]|uniref:FHA domain-containing protein n=1 Tax=Dendrothele bispora (strain CBS 962.96) TaxID=1314807 RepID=A0A4S8M124_DENBC|nr:hypothetical protein K435DRAFT_798072 [Dendrothele bispora CBS 962.96]